MIPSPLKLGEDDLIKHFLNPFGEDFSDDPVKNCFQANGLEILSSNNRHFLRTRARTIKAELAVLMASLLKNS